MQAQDFFMAAITSSIHHHQKSGQKRDDFLQLMLEAREDKLKVVEAELDHFEKDAQLKDEDEAAPTSDLLDNTGIVANAVLFMVRWIKYNIIISTYQFFNVLK